MVTRMMQKNLFLLAVVLTAVLQNEPQSQVVAEIAHDEIFDGRRLEYIPERRPRIHGGWDTDEDRHLYAHVNLKWQLEGHQCGGSLIAPDMVLTAAHCYGSFDRIEIGKYEKYDATDISEEFVSEFEIVHPDYDAETTRFDVMLIKLNGRSTLAKPVRINRDESIPSNGSILTVIGMGYNANWELPDVFQEATVRYQINDECDDIVDEYGISLKGDLYPDMMCAGFEGRDSCYGDSGSPLIIKGENDQLDVQIGLVSWGYQCAGTLPGIYSRLSYPPIYDFIQEQVCIHSASPPRYFGCATEEPSWSPTELTTFSPTTVTSIESEEPTTERLGQAVAGGIFLHESDLTLKTTNLDDTDTTEDEELPATPSTSANMLNDISSATHTSSSTSIGVMVYTVLSAFWACIFA